jgi:hypothetical protein
MKKVNKYNILNLDNSNEQYNKNKKHIANKQTKTNVGLYYIIITQ